MEERHDRGKVVRAWRLSQDPPLKMSPLARLIPCDVSLLRRFELGIEGISVPIATRICEVTGLPIELLLSPKQLADVRGAARMLGSEGTQA